MPLSAYSLISPLATPLPWLLLSPGYSSPCISHYFIVVVSSDAIHPYDGYLSGQLDRIQIQVGVKPLGMSDWGLLLLIDWFD